MKKPNEAAPSSRPPKKDNDRLAKALRDNLFRRKAQARARAEGETPDTSLDSPSETGEQTDPIKPTGPKGPSGPSGPRG